MSKHKMVDGKLLQMNKRYKNLKNRQKDKIAGWMYEAYKKQMSEGLSNDEAFALVMDKINEAQIWVPEYEVEQKYNSMKKRFKDRMAAETTGCLAENIGSERVMQKNGLIKEAEHIDYEWHDGKMKTRLEYRLLRKEWKNNGTSQNK